MAEVVVGRMEMYGSKVDGQRAMVPPLALDLSSGNDSSNKSSELRWKEIFLGKYLEIERRSQLKIDGSERKTKDGCMFSMK